MFITNQDELAQFAGRAMGASLLAIDTEFLREKTYYPRLCLLQMATPDEVVIVDPFAVRDLRVLVPVMESPSTLKLFHAGSQDMEILYRECGVVPHPVFDTQVAATLLCHTQQIAYAALVSSLCGVTLKKLDSFTDWSRRPLSRSQVEYAADDVAYLPEIYRKMDAELRELGRREWLDVDFRAMEDPSKYDVDVYDRYRHLKRVSQLNSRQLSAARELAAWRERYAQRADIPRKWVVTDEQIVEACKREAKTVDDLFMVRGVSEKVSLDEARQMVECLKRGLSAPPETWPHVDRPGKSEANVDVVVDAMSAIVRLRARQNNIAFQTLANHSQLSAIARGHGDVEILQGWRREIVGNDLLAFLRGELSISCEEGNLKVTRGKTE